MGVGSIRLGGTEVAVNWIGSEKTVAIGEAMGGLVGYAEGFAFGVQAANANNMEANTS